MADRVESMDPGSPAEGTAGPAGYLFISYASHDADVAQSVCLSLEAAGLPCWIAPRDVKAGTQYADAIVRAINDAQAVVLVLSASAVASSHVGREVERAASKHKQIVTFRIDTAALNPALEYFLGESQWIDVPKMGMPAALAKLAEAVGRGPASPAQQISAAKHPRGAKKVIAITAIIVAVGLSVVLGLHFWSLARNGAHPAATLAIAAKSIAVLPFVDMSEAKDQEYFADGMAEEVLDLLAKIPGLKVIGRTSSFQFKGKNEDLRAIGAKLGAAYVVEGSVRKAGPRIRVTAQLIDAASGEHRWSESYDRDFGEILALQDEIATGIARALQLTVDVENAPRLRQHPNPEAYTLYLRGLLELDKVHLAQLLEADRDFEQALSLDPSFLRAAEALAITHVAQGFDEDVLSRDAWQHAREAAERALRIDANSAPAHSVLGLVHAEDKFDWTAADAELHKSFALNPRDPVALRYAAIVAQSRGQYQEAQRLINASLARDPLDPFSLYTLGDILFVMGDFDAAELALRKSIAVSPTFDGNHYYLGRMLLARGQVEAALKEFQTEPAPDAKDAGLAMVYHSLGRKQDSDAALERLIRASGDTWPYSVSIVHAYRSERNEAFEWLEKAYASRDADLLASVLGDPELAPLRADPRYKALLRKMNLPD